MDALIYVLPIVIIAALVAIIVYKIKGNAQTTIPPTQIVAMNLNYNGVRKDVVIKDFGSKKLETIKCIREATGCGLKEAKYIVESKGIVEALPVETAEALASTLNGIGCSAEIR